MPEGRVGAIFISPIKGGQMQHVEEVRAITGAGLEGDRYFAGTGSFNKGEPGKRQVTLINGAFFDGSSFEYSESRRNIITFEVELMWLIGREFQIGTARMRGVKYCDPCLRPGNLAGKKASFRDEFFDRGGLIASVVADGVIRTGDLIIPEPKRY
jgi:MOSC domain-containing protein YiiM